MFQRPTRTQRNQPNRSTFPFHKGIRSQISKYLVDFLLAVFPSILLLGASNPDNPVVISPLETPGLKPGLTNGNSEGPSASQAVRCWALAFPPALPNPAWRARPLRPRGAAAAWEAFASTCGKRVGFVLEARYGLCCLVQRHVPKENPFSFFRLPLF